MRFPVPSTRWLALAAAAALLFVVSTPIALLADCLLVALLFVDWRRAAEIEVERHLPRQLSLGAALPARLVLQAPRGARVRVTDDAPRGVRSVGEDLIERSVPPGEPVEVTCRFDVLERGRHVFGDIHLRVLGPWGLAWRGRTVHRRDEVRVVPGLAEMKRLRLLGLRERLRRAGLRSTRLRGEGHSFESLREYAAGDDPRTIDWKASAHRAALMVREYEAERSQSVMLVLDAGRLMTERIGERERLDHAMSAALLLADVAGLHGDRVGFYAFADEVLQFLPPRRLAVDRLSRAMADVTARMVEPNYPVAFSTLRRRLGRRALIVVFTDVIDSAASHALLAHLALSSARHLVLAVTIRNPALEAWAESVVASDADAYRRAAAEEMLAARALALASMRRMGVLVVDVAPDQAVTDVVNRYLEIKYRGRL